MKIDSLLSDCSCCNSDQTQLIDNFIQDVTIKKKTIVSTMDSVKMLMREVEYEERAAETAKEEADRCSLDILAKLARAANVQKDLLASKSNALQLQAARLLDNGDRSLDLLGEMHRALKKRLTSALMEKELANKKKQENEASAQAALSFEKIQIKRAKKEYKRLKLEAVEISKLQEFLLDRGHVIDMLRGEISDKCQAVKLLKDELDQAILPGGIMSSSRKSSILASLSSSSVHWQPHTQGNSSDSRPNAGFKTGIKNLNGVGDITRNIKKWKVKGKVSGKGVFARIIKKVKIKGKLNGIRLFAKRVEKVKVKGKLRRNRMCAISMKKVTIKGNLHQNRICAKSRKKVNIKGKLHGSRTCAKSTKKAKIKTKLRVTRMLAKRRLKGKLRESRIFA